MERAGGAGDKGRDIIAYIDPDVTYPRKWDNYQCKHYKDPISPSDIWVELGKLCFYTYRCDYTIPESYYFVSSKGCGPSLVDLLDRPDKINKQLIDNWNKKCEREITKKAPIVLEGRFLSYVEKFNFSIIKRVTPITLLDQHSKTRYHAMIFGSRLKARPTPPSPPPNINQVETRYVDQLFEAFSDHLKKTVSNVDDIKNIEHLITCFVQARNCFYSAEALKSLLETNYQMTIILLT